MNQLLLLLTLLAPALCWPATDVTMQRQTLSGPQYMQEDYNPLDVADPEGEVVSCFFSVVT